MNILEGRKVYLISLDFRTIIDVVNETVLHLLPLWKSCIILSSQPETRGQPKTRKTG
jgi:hypothetical protein